MNFILEQKDLIALVAAAAGAASSNNTIPALGGMLLEAADGKLTVTAMDMELGIRVSTSKVQIVNEGKALVNARYFEDLVKRLPAGLVTLELVQPDNKLRVKYGKSSAKFNVLGDTELIKWPVESIEELFSLPENILKNALVSTVWAVAKNHFRQVFTGVLVDVTPNEIKFVGTDTHKLSIYSTAIENGKTSSNIVPAKSVVELTKQLKGEEPIFMGVSGNNVVFYKENFEMFTRTLEGQFPNYMQVVPQNFTSSFEYNVEEFKQGLQRISVLPSDGKLQINTLSIKAENPKNIESPEAVLSGASDLAGEIRETISLKKLEGEIDILFNAAYFQEALKFQPTESKIKFNGPLGPALLQGEENYLVVIVPLRPAA